MHAINEHLTNIDEEGGLTPEATIREFRIVRQEGARQVACMIDHYNLESILGIGYKARSPRGAQFRPSATERLGEYLVNGFTMNDARLKGPLAAGGEVPYHLGELLARIHDICAGKKRATLRRSVAFSVWSDLIRANMSAFGGQHTAICIRGS